MIESQTMTLGYQVMLDCEDGYTFFTIWITEKNKERAMKAFAALGVMPEQMRDPAYIEYKLGDDIVGREVTFGTKEEEYGGRKTVKVAWIGKSSMAADGNKAVAVARFFGMSGGPITDEDPVTDAEIPF